MTGLGETGEQLVAGTAYAGTTKGPTGLRAVLTTLAAAFVAAGVLSPAGLAGPQNGDLAWAQPAGYQEQIFRSSSVGGPVELTSVSENTQPSFSPDGRRIAFSSERATQSQIWVMDADGSNQVQVSNDPLGAFWPAWSPDGAAIGRASCRERV